MEEKKQSGGERGRDLKKMVDRYRTEIKTMRAKRKGKEREAGEKKDMQTEKESETESIDEGERCTENTPQSQ